jgi:hypothetical protein
MSTNPDVEPTLPVYPKLKLWTTAVDSIIDKVTPGRLRTALEATRTYMQDSREKGLYWLNPAHVVVHPKRWWGRWLSNGSQTLTLSATPRNGFHTVGVPFAALSETRYVLWSPHWWQMRFLKKRMMRVDQPRQLMVRLSQLFMEYYRRALPPEMDGLQRMLMHLYVNPVDAPREVFWLNNLDGTIEIIGTYSNGGGNYASFWTVIDPAQLKPRQG